MAGEEELAARLARADAGELSPPAAAQPAAPGTAGALAAPDPEREKWIGAALYFGKILRTGLPDHARPVWTDERLAELGAELANCAKHYGWTFADLLTHPLARLAGVAGALAWPLAEPHLMPFIKAQFGRQEKDALGGSVVAGSVPEKAPASAKPSGKIEPLL